MSRHEEGLRPLALGEILQTLFGLTPGHDAHYLVQARDIRRLLVLGTLRPSGAIALGEFVRAEPQKFGEVAKLEGLHKRNKRVYCAHLVPADRDFRKHS